MFDAHSIVERKNPIGVIRAFKQAFGKGEDVRLVLKLVHADHAIGTSIAAEAKDDRILIIRQGARARGGELAYRGMRLLCFPAPVRGLRYDDFGVHGVGQAGDRNRVLGQHGFHDTEQQFHRRVRSDRTHRDYPPYPCGSVWANPNVDHASRFNAPHLRRPEVPRARSESAQHATSGSICLQRSWASASPDDSNWSRGT